MFMFISEGASMLFNQFFVSQIKIIDLQNNKELNLIMNPFDPFISSEYHRNLKDETPIESQPTLMKKTQSEFLSQILSSPLTAPHKEFTQHTESFQIAEKQSQNCIVEQNSMINTSSENLSKNTSKNSPFHNFQKHLVITLRQTLNLKGLLKKGGIETELAENIFHYFKRSQKTSRTFLDQVFGLSEAKDLQSCCQFIKSIRQGELKQIINAYEDETIIGAQMILRHLARNELEDCNLLEALSHRKIEKKEQFIEYVNLFKKELLEGKQRKKTFKLLAKKFNKL